MPFFDDNAPDESALRSPVWSSFAIVKDNLERLIAVNLFWSLQLLPALVALAFSWWWPWLRILFVLGSATSLAASTGVLYGMVKRVCEQEPLSLDLLRDTFRELALPSMRKLAPLYGTGGVCLFLVLLVPITRSLALEVAVYYCAILLLVLSMYWGPLFADNPDVSAWTMFKRSVLFVWRYPAQTVISGFVILFALALGAISIGGIFLIVPVLIAILQTRRYQEVAEREHLRHERRKSVAVKVNQS